MAPKGLQDKLRSVIDRGDERLLRMMLATAKEYYRHEPSPVTQSGVRIVDPAPLNENITDGGPLFRLVYTSARSPECDEDCIRDILSAAARNNPGLGITGLLIYTNTRFLQILEGPHDYVTNIYQKIEKDTRHGGSQMRYCELTTERHFANWHMAQKEIREGQVDFATNINEQEKELYASLMDGNLHDYKDEGMRVLKTFLAIA